MSSFTIKQKSIDKDIRHYYETYATKICNLEIVSVKYIEHTKYFLLV